MLLSPKRLRERAGIFAALLLRQAHQGVVAADRKLTVERCLRLWLVDVAARRVRPRTLEVYQTVVDRHGSRRSAAGRFTP